MPYLSQTFNWGSALVQDNPELLRQLDQSRTETVQVVNTKISRYITDSDAPNSVTANDVNKYLEIGDIWVNRSGNKAWIMTSRTSDVLVTWTLIT